MKQWLLIAMLFLSLEGKTQSQEVQQLLLNVEKLGQFKKILQNMVDGWNIVNKGYTAIKDLAAGDFRLHQHFLDDLLQVGPVVRQYKRTQSCFQYLQLLLRETKQTLQQFRVDSSFSIPELQYIEKVYANLLREGLHNLEELLLAITAGQLRMSDEERLRVIDEVYTRMEDQFQFLQDFNSGARYLSLQRKHEKASIDLSRKIQGF